MKLKTPALWKTSYDKPRQHIKKQRHHTVDKRLYSQSCGFFQQSCTDLWELTIKKAMCWIIDGFELWCWRRLLRVPRIQRRSNLCFDPFPFPFPFPKGNQSWIFTGRTDAEAKVLILWPPEEKSWLIGKDHDVGKDWRQEEKGRAEDEMVGWHHWLNGHESEQALGVGDGQGGLVCCSQWGCKESDMT